MARKEPRYTQAIAWAVFALALMLLVMGSMRVYSVLPDPALVSAPAPSGPPPFEPFFPEPPLYSQPSPPPPTIDQLTDLGMVEHATFTGVRQQDGRFYLTYDPSQKKGKRSCPT